MAVTAAAPGTPWLGPNGTPVTDVSGFAKVLDYVTIMNYDIWGPWSPTVGPNAPLDDSCAPKADQAGSAMSAVQAWKKAGMPLNKLVLGIPSYGHSYRVRKQNAYVNGVGGQLALYPKFDANAQPAGDKWDAPAGAKDPCNDKVSTQPGGIIQYWGMIFLGYIDQNGNPKPGKTYRFDTCSNTVCFLVRLFIVYLSVLSAIHIRSVEGNHGFLRRPSGESLPRNWDLANRHYSLCAPRVCLLNHRN